MTEAHRTEDLVSMLRNQVEYWNSGLRFVAADEIERLRQELADVRKQLPYDAQAHQARYP